MTDRKTLYDGVSHAAWGYFFLYFNINLGSINILPAFVGWLLFLSAINKLKEERRDLALLRPLGTLLAVWNAVDWLAACFGTSISGRFPPLDLIVAVAGMYFHFQFLTDCAALAAAYQQPEDGLDRRLLHWRTVQTVLLTVATLALLAAERLGEAWAYVSTALGLAYLLAGICLMAALFALRKCVREEDGPPEAPDPPAPAEP
nr:hypothetical protein [uncultured Oscillibacter sp.]